MGEPDDGLTFLMTDVVGSTRLWEGAPEQMRVAMARHDAIAAEVIAQHGGVLDRQRGEGDSVFAVFDDPSDAVQGAVALQLAMRDEPWPALTPIRTRVAVHSGPVQRRDGDFYGETVNRCARLRGVTYGGQILVSAVTRALASAELDDALEFVAVGEVSLRDLREPEFVWQVVHPRLERSFPPPIGRRGTGLPLQLTSFVGRESELEAMQTRIGEHQLITLTGPPGVGKTRLAIQAAAGAAARLGFEAVFVDLASISDPDEVMVLLALSLGVVDAPGSYPTVIARAVADRPLLVVIDNCEHLLHAAGLAATTLSGAAEHVRVVATSRQPLGVPGEHVVRVAGLNLPATGDGPHSEVAGAVRLFVERLRSRGVADSQTPEHLRLVGEICRRVDGLPLAVEFAAAYAARSSERELLRLMDQSSLALGAIGEWSGPERHRTLDAAHNWSFRLLDLREQAVLARLSVFQGGFTLALAAAVCADIAEADAIVDIMSTLVDKSLVHVQDRHGSLRYRLLETTGNFAADRLRESGTTRSAEVAHAEAMISSCADTAVAFDDGNADVAVRRTRIEWPNIAAALHRAFDGQVPVGLGVRLAAAVGLALPGAVGTSETVRWLTTALTHSDSMRTERISLLAAHAMASIVVDDVVNARTATAEAIALLDERQGRTYARLLVLRANALIAEPEPDVVAGMALLDEAARSTPDDSNTAVLRARIEFNRARIAYFAGELTEAERGFVHAVRAFNRLGRVAAEANVRIYLAEISALRGDRSAVEMARTALDMTRTTGDAIDEGDALLTLAIAQTLAGDPYDARDALFDAYEALHRQGRENEISIALQTLMILAGTEGQWATIAETHGALDNLRQTQRVQAIADLSNSFLARAREHLDATEFNQLANVGRRLTADELGPFIRGN